MVSPGDSLQTRVWVITAPASAGLARSILPEGSRITEARLFWLENPVRPLRVGTEQTGSRRAPVWDVPLSGTACVGLPPGWFRGMSGYTRGRSGRSFTAQLEDLGND